MLNDLLFLYNLFDLFFLISFILFLHLTYIFLHFPLLTLALLNYSNSNSHSRLLLILQKIKILINPLNLRINIRHPLPTQSPNLAQFPRRLSYMPQLHPILLHLPPHIFIPLDLLQADVPVMQLRVVQTR